MLYTEFIHKAEELTLVQDDNTQQWYLEPEWMDILYRNGLGELDELNDSYISGWYDVEDILKLEAEKRNKLNDKTPYVMNWLYDLLTAKIEPAMLQEETDYIKQVTEFMKANHEQGIEQGKE